MEYLRAHRGQRGSQAMTAILSVIVCLALLTGCGGGGGGGSSNTVTFRILPSGGSVSPLTGVVLTAPPGAVASAVQVTASTTTLSAGSHPGGVDVPALAAVQLQFNPNDPAVSLPITLTLPYTLPTTEGDLHVYYTTDGVNWTVLPGTTVNTTSGTVTVNIETLDASGNPVPGLMSGTYAIFGETPPGAPSL
jgi:hypothetical protein